MPNLPSTGVVSTEMAVEIISSLPIPVFVAEARGPKRPLVLANAAFERLTGEDAAILGRPLSDVLGGSFEDEGDALDELLTGAAAGTAVASHRVGIVARTAAGDPVATTCWLSVTPLTDDDGVWGLVGTLLDAAGESPEGPRRRRRDALRDIACDLGVDRPFDDILADVVAAVAETAGAGRAAIMTSDGRSAFSVIASHGDASLPGVFDVTHAAESLIDVAWGRTRLVWSSERDALSPAAEALPFIGEPGWERAIVVGTRLRGGGFGLIAVGDPQDERWDDGALERLDFAAVLIAAALGTAQLRGEFSRLEELLSGAVAASAGLAGGTDPGEARRAIVRTIVGDMNLAGAALWVPDSEGRGEAVLVASAGLPDDVATTVAVLPPGDAVAETAAGVRRWRIPSGATSARAWPDHHLHVVPVPEPATGALGVYSAEPLPGAAQEIFATLAQALASAAHEATLHRRARSVVEALQHQLQPRLLELPSGFDVAHVYQSATAGVPIGGDFLDVFRTTAGHIGVACGDVSGKGIQAATLSAMAVHSLRAFALQGAMPRIVAAMMDAAVEAQTGDDRFLTMAYGRVDPREWTVELSVAGHPPPILVTPDGATVLDVRVDVPVGMIGSSPYHQTAFSLPEDHSLVLYTDGVTEARTADEERELFGMERLTAVLDQLRGQPARAVADAVWAAVQDWADGETTDDCAVLVLRHAPVDSA